MSKCQYSEDVGMPEHRCVIKCQYEVDAEALVKAERDRCLSIVDEYYGGGRTFVMRKITESGPASPSPASTTARSPDPLRVLSSLHGSGDLPPEQGNEQ